MPRVSVDSLDDPRLDVYRHLTRTNLTRWSGQFIAEGKLVVRRLVESSLETVSVLVTDRREDEAFEWLPEGITTFVVPLPVAQELVGYNFHNGYLACGRRPAAFTVRRFLEARADRSALTAVVCPNVSDPENIGALIRISDGFGVDLMVLGRGCSDPFSRRVLRVSMGAAFRLPILQTDDLAAAVTELRRDGRFETAATVLDPAADPLATAARGARLALLFGNEAFGLDATSISLCDRRLTIPMAPGADSLNVGVAAGIFLHHFLRTVTPGVPA